MKAYNAANQSEADMLLSENVEALSSGDCYPGVFYCIPRPGSCCYWGGQVCFFCALIIKKVNL